MKIFLLKFLLIFFVAILFSCEKSRPSKEIVEGKYALKYYFPGNFLDKNNNVSFELLSDGSMQFFNTNLAVITGYNFNQEELFDLSNYTGKWIYDQRNGKINISIDNNNSIKNKRTNLIYPWRVIGEEGENVTIIVLDGNESTYSIFEKIRKK